MRCRENLHGLGAMVATRLGITAAAVCAVTFLIFGLAAVSPFDPLAYHLGTQYGRYTPDELAHISASMGLDRPWWQQCLAWWGGVFHGDLGYSRIYQKPVIDVIGERLPWTLLLSGTGLALAFVLALIGGVWASRKPDGLVSRLMSGLGMGLAATPSFVYALAVIVVFGTFLHAIPLGGAAPPGSEPTLATVGPYLVAPALVLALSQVAWPLLSLQEAAARARYSAAVEAAEMRDLSERTVLLRHVLPMSLLPMVTVIGTRLGELIVGAVIIESVFSWPGLAAATVESAIAVDFPLLAVVTAATTGVVMLGSLFSDVAYLVIDPRVSDV